jgi:hypothetical protein
MTKTRHSGSMGGGATATTDAGEQETLGVLRASPLSAAIGSLRGDLILVLAEGPTHLVSLGIAVWEPSVAQFSAWPRRHCSPAAANSAEPDALALAGAVRRLQLVARSAAKKR